MIHPVTAPLRILQIVHGYPPSEVAGVEQHTRNLCQHLADMGHHIHVLAATRAPGRPQYSLIKSTDGAVTLSRLVNNIPARPLAHAEQDRAVDTIVRRLAADFRPDVVHIQHLQFLSSSLRFRAPVVITLHDGWAWCPSGGTELLPDHTPCDGPTPERCPPCHAAWRPVPSPTARRLMSVAGRLAPLVPPEKLHRLWARLPERLRRPVAAGGPSPTEPPSAAQARAQAMRDLYTSAALRLAPSRYLARRAEAMGLGAVELHENSPAISTRPRRGGGPLVFLGTLAPHKGPLLVLDAWKRAFPEGTPDLRFYGPRSTAPVPSERWGGVLDRDGVSEVLAGATALVMGSRWPENAPLVLLEARAAGCPVVAPRIGGIPELVEHGVDGLLYPPGDVDALAAALRQIVATPTGPSRPPPAPRAQAESLVSHYRELC
ncbi:MAG: glycosyltransferase involved in cell wall biosynthesis [Myxococcota bacterium]|jgi:glycosyltransferase involved in cell wall biosynthesis